MDYPRVTEVLRGFTKYDQIPKKILEGAAIRGNTVHSLCAGIAKGDWLPESMINEDYKGYVNSFKQWRDAQVSEFLHIERRFKDDSLRYTGQVDMVFKGTDQRVYLADLKTTSKPVCTFPVQMAAYHNLLAVNNIQITSAMLVYLKKNGDFPDIDIIEDFKEPMDVFNKALYCHNYFNKEVSRDRRTESLPENS